MTQAGPLVWQTGLGWLVLAGGERPVPDNTDLFDTVTLRWAYPGRPVAVLPTAGGGRAYSPRFLFMWPNGNISVMGGEQAASVLATVKRAQLEARGNALSDAEAETFKAPVLEQYRREDRLLSTDWDPSSLTG